MEDNANYRFAINKIETIHRSILRTIFSLKLSEYLGRISAIAMFLRAVFAECTVIRKLILDFLFCGRHCSGWY